MLTNSDLGIRTKAKKRICSPAQHQNMNMQRNQFADLTLVLENCFL